MMRNTKVVSITLPPPLYEQAQALAKEENRTMSELIREALRRYQRERLWERLQAQMQEAGDRLGIRTEEDIVNLVRQVRREMAEEKAAENAMLPTGTE
jgi:CopG family transcriptional regulator/antitoxin EndoAI